MVRNKLTFIKRVVELWDNLTAFTMGLFIFFKSFYGNA